MQIKIASGCVRGLAHESLSLPCQDEVFAIQQQHQGVIALADGAGSRVLSHIGARIACECICQVCMDEFDDLFTMKEDVASQYLVEVIQSKMKDSGYELQSISCTLLFYAVKHDRFFMGHIGDGMIFRVMQHTAYVASYPENGEEDNQTYFITDATAASHLRIQKGNWEECTCIILTSDGGMESLYERSSKQPVIALEKMTQWLIQETEKDVSVALHDNIKEIFTQHSKDDISVHMMLCVASQEAL